MLEFRIIDIVSLSIGVLGIILASVALLGLRRKRIEESRDRLSIKLSKIEGKDFPNGTLRLDVWNAGRKPVRLKKLQLIWGDGTPSKVGLIPYDPTRDAVIQSVSEEPLHECEGSTFVLPPLPPGMLARATEQAAERIWIAIEGENGEIARVSGERLLPMLRGEG